MNQDSLNTLHGALGEPFGQLVQMLVQHAALALGQLPHPQSGKAELNPQVARLMLDHLAVLEEKTTGNLNEVEAALLTQARQSLEAQYEQISSSTASSSNS